MDELKYWLAFNNIHGLGSVSILKIYDHFKSIKEAWCASSADLHRVNNITPNIIEKIITERSKISPDQLIEEAEALNIKVCGILDSAYPALLKEIHNPPVVLYYIGNFLECNFDKTIALVGTRTPTDYGRETAQKLSKKLADYGMTIVSGLAEGIDTCVHTACIQQSGQTIAVLGSGLNQIFPKINVHLATRIAEGNYGAVISEYCPDTKPEAWRFPYRNRIISGLSRATIVVESKAKGGALITAKYALEQNREVFAVPSRVLDNSNAGAHNLVKRGEARLLTSYVSLFDDLNLSPEVQKIEETEEMIPENSQKERVVEKNISPEKSPGSKRNFEQQQKEHKKEVFENNSAENQPQLPAGLSEMEQIILNHLTTDPWQFDILLQKTGLSAPALLSSLTMLELKGFIKQLDGKRYRKNY